MNGVTVLNSTTEKTRENCFSGKDSLSVSRRQGVARVVTSRLCWGADLCGSLPPYFSAMCSSSSFHLAMNRPAPSITAFKSTTYPRFTVSSSSWDITRLVKRSSGIRRNAPAQRARLVLTVLSSTLSKAEHIQGLTCR